MSVSTEVRRTLVKSPPELWAELSDPDALGRHLGELGEIRITHMEPEAKVEWEADGVTGVVELKPSGWGTKVTLSVTRDAATVEGPQLDATAEPDADAAGEPNADAEPHADAEPDPALEPEPLAAVELDAEAAITATDAEIEAFVEPQPDVAEGETKAKADAETAEVAGAAAEAEPVVEPGRRRRFFARVFRRRWARQRETVELGPEPEPDPRLEFVALAAPEPIYPDRPPEPAVDLAAELASVEDQMTQETTELLTGVLDRLGAAHHRPFSRG